MTTTTQTLAAPTTACQGCLRKPDAGGTIDHHAECPITREWHELAARQPLLQKAFDLVCPAEHAKKLAERGLIPAEVAAKVSWRGPICALILATELDEAGVTLAEVCEAIEFFTATEASVSCELVGERAGDPLPRPPARGVPDPGRGLRGRPGGRPLGRRGLRPLAEPPGTDRGGCARRRNPTEEDPMARANSETLAALATLVEQHGASTVIEAIADACDACADIDDDNGEKLHEVAGMLRMGAAGLAEAEAARSIAPISAGLEVLADLAADDNIAHGDPCPSCGESALHRGGCPERG